MTQTVSTYLASLLEPSCTFGIDFDHVYELAHLDHAEGSVDLLVVVAHAFSEMSVSPQQVPRVVKLVQDLALNVLEFNVGEGAVWSGEAQEVLERANGGIFEEDSDPVEPVAEAVN